MDNKKDLVTVKVAAGGPYLIEGEIKLIDKNGKEKIMNGAHLCRCGQSKNKPFCDGSHHKVDFDKE